MSVQQINEQNYWKAYCQIIKSAIQPTLGPNSALFFCTETTRCIPAADWIPPEITNLSLYFMADSLLDPMNLFYVPNRSNSFIKSLQTYLSWVDIGGSKDDGVIGRFLTAQTNLTAAQEGKAKALTAALTEYQQAKTAGITALDFNGWAASNAAAYNAVVKTYQGIAGQYKKAAIEMNGPVASQYNRDMDVIEAALDQQPVPGVTMSVTNADLNSLSSQLTQSLAGNPPTLAPATGVYQKGAYSLQGYASTLKTWYNNFHNYKKNPQSKPLSLNSGKNVSLHDLGFTDTSGVGGISWAPFISFGASFNSSDTRESMKIENEDFGIDMKFTYGDMQAFTINPGNWYFGNPKGPYPTLRQNAPSQVSNLVKPVSLLCGTAIGLDITFSGAAARSFDAMYKHYQSINGGLRIFCFNIGLAGNQTSSDTSISHFGTWDGNSGHFVVSPVDSAGWCTLLGVLGEKLI